MALTRKFLPNGKSIAGISRSETDYLYKEIFEDRAYVFESAAPLPAEPVIFDVGANIGIFSLFAVQQWPGARVFAFEPVPQVFEALQQNLGASAGVTLHNMALGNEAETREIVYYPNYTMMSGFAADAQADRAVVEQYVRNTTEDLANGELKAAVLENLDSTLDGRFEQQLISVEVQRVTDMMNRHHIDRIDLLKIDVEGFELQVLQGIEEGAWPSIGSAVVEVSDRDGELAAIEGLFKSHGMRTEVRQVSEYRETDLHILFAERQ
ncbi:FkbM family methyltransferase [Kitasatospora sp. RB6PN24]|uniref:FkbM family methyltransferase n=1 Tax=Kitasatospora humi TaxID=2893891 RepID=UPI001E307C99|nr:FkbM family methyltransferase [Kitasatospora humi]MCC9311439.1 FkbM family methyltransferase [Kitasatospora humi]